MSRTATRTAALAAALFWGVATAPAAEEARASLAAALSLHDPETGRTVRAEAGEPFRLSVTLTDVTTGRTPRGLTLAGWIRPSDPRNSSCAAAAQAFRVTAEPPIGATDLNGILLVSVNEDASVGVIDPKLNLRSSNMIAAATLDTPPAAMAVDPNSFHLFVLSASGPGVTAMSLLTGAREMHFSETALSDVTAVAGRVWLGRTDGQIFDFEAPEEARRVGTGAIRLRRATEPESPLVAAFGAGGGLTVFDAGTGREIYQRPGHEALIDLALLSDGTVLSLPEENGILRVIYADAPDLSVDIRIGMAAKRVVASPNGRYAIAYAHGGPAAVVIDVARGEVVQPLALNEGGISDVAFTDEAAYLLSLDGGFVGLIDLNSVAPGRGAQIRKIDLAHKASLPRSGEGLLVPLWPSPQVIAVSPDTHTGWLLHDDQAVGEMPPMDSIRLRGGVPRRVAVLDRSLREVAPGRFETVAVLPGGPHELVLTTGIGGMTACLPLPVQGVSAARGIEPVTLSFSSVPPGGVVAGQDIEIALAFRDQAGTVMPVERAEFFVPSLVSSWVGRISFRRAEDGMLRGHIRFPHPGPFALQPVALPDTLYLKSALLVEVSP